MAKSKARAILEQQYKQELNRIKRFIASAEKRGYRFDSNIIPQQTDHITVAEVRKLKELTPARLYSMSTALSDSGDIVIGTQKRAEERSKAAVKGAKTKVQQLAPIPQTPTTFKQARDAQDNLERDRLETDKEFSDKFYEGEIVYRRILEMINDVNFGYPRASQHLRSVLDYDIETYGKEAVMENIANSPQLAIDFATYALLYDEGSANHDTAIRELQMIITGTVPTAQEARDLQDAIDEDSYMDTV